MHPEVEQDKPGDCPICGLRLEPKTVTLDDEEDDSELHDMSRRFWIGLVLTVPLFAMTFAKLPANSAIFSGEANQESVEQRHARQRLILFGR